MKMSQIIDIIVANKLAIYIIEMKKIDYDIDNWEEILFNRLACLGHEVDIIPVFMYKQDILKIEIKYLSYNLPERVIDYEHDYGSFM
jgi:Holliday junction resolvase-like predicted endonuclease